MFRQWFCRPRKQYSQSLQGRLGEMATRSPAANFEPWAPIALIVPEIMQIGSANPACFDGDLDLARSGCFHLALLEPEIAGGMNDNGFHGWFP
jgi:hypothetical protein